MDTKINNESSLNNLNNNYSSERRLGPPQNQLFHHS